MNIWLCDEAATLGAGATLAKALGELAPCGAGRDSHALSSGVHVHLDGGLGAGKTTLVRGLLRALGVCGSVKSPTYTLVEPYQTSHWEVFHFDLYRLVGDEELDALGARDHFRSGCLCLFEWPSKCAGALPEPTLVVRLRVVDDGRQLQIEAQNAAGEVILAAFEAALES